LRSGDEAAGVSVGQRHHIEEEGGSVARQFRAELEREVAGEADDLGDDSDEISPPTATVVRVVSSCLIVTPEAGLVSPDECIVVVFRFVDRVSCAHAVRRSAVGS